MGDRMINCPLCCNDTFKTKQELYEHLSQLSSNLICPVCDERFSSLEILLGHIRDDDCLFANIDQTDQTIVIEDDREIEINENSLDNTSIKLTLQDSDMNIQSDIIEDQVSAINVNDTMKLNSDNEAQVGKMYVELLSKQLMKPCLQTQEVKLVQEGDQSRYVIWADESNMSSGVSVVTKQNNDGTISLTTSKDNTVSNVVDNTNSENQSLEPQLDKSLEEVYSCNTCGVSFSSVLEHIQNYHNDQDVVVEDPGEDVDNNPLEYKQIAEEQTDKQTSRRMITDTGDIIETPVLQDSSNGTDELRKIPKLIKEESMDTQTHKNIQPQRYLQVDKFAKLLVREIKPVDTKSDKLLHYHKVVAKEMQTMTGDVVKVYNCTWCNVYVSDLGDFKQHPCKVLKYPCSLCPLAYDNAKSLCAHMKVHKSKSQDITYIPPTKFECEICCTTFRTSKSLKLHKRMHDPIKSRPIDPPVETPEGMAASEDKFLCSICDKLIPIDYRIIHQNSHKSSNKMNCDICNKKFHSKEYLDMHMTVHNMDKVTVGKQDKALPYTCLYCNRKFARPHEKVKHERIHTGEKPHECEICGKAFRVSYCLTLHMRTHTGARPYACPHCNKRFKAHSVYNHHLLTHSEVRAYKCPFCPKAFKTSVQLAGHKNSHTKPFSCNQCNRPFASLYAVRVHMGIHSRQNSLKFSCNTCGASYARAFALKDHIKQVHKQDMKGDNLVAVAEDEWMPQENGDVDSDGMQLSKELPQDINELGIHENELIIP